MITLSVLSWGSPKTLAQTLDACSGMSFTDKQIFFQEISEKDIEIANHYKYYAMGSTKNLHISGGYAQLIRACRTEYMLFLENDWKMIRSSLFADEVVEQGMRLLKDGSADVVRLRAREAPGSPLWTAQFAGNEMSRPEHLLDCVHWEPNPSKFEAITEVEPGTYCTTSKFANWTNNPTLFRTDFLRNHIYPRLLNGNDVERNLQSWWQTQEFKVCQGIGLFTHDRIDR